MTVTDARDERIVVEPNLAPARRSGSRTSGRTRGVATSATGARSWPGSSSSSILLFCLIWPIISPYTGNEVDFTAAKQARAWSTRSARTSSGATSHAHGGGRRVSILIGFGATLAILLIGVVYGSISGFVGGRLDNGMMRFLDALYGLPYLPFAIITLAIIGTTNKWTMMIALSIASWFTTARIVRGQVLTLKENDYVRAAKAVGALVSASSPVTCCRTRWAC